MNDAALPLATLAVFITLGEQFSLARASGLWTVFIRAGAYGLMTLALTSSLPAAVALAGLAAAGGTLAEVAFQRRGPGLWTALAVLLAPYLALWWAWALTQPVGRPPVLRAVVGVAQRLAVGGAVGPQFAAHALMLVCAYVFCWGSATFLTRSVLGGYAAHTAVVTRRQAAHAEVAAAEDPTEQGLLRAGRLIGELERFLTLSLALTGNYTAIAFVIAAKSIARFDLARRHGEYFLVGTLCSIGTSLGVGILVAHVLKG